jgi:hypothetical protein
VSDYTDFLSQKIKLAQFKGFKVEPVALHPALFPHQRDIVRWAVLGGNRAIFASFGLGKSVMQCEWLRQIALAVPGDEPLLIVCPLQFDIVDRLIDRYSNPDEVVYDPFCGLGTVPYRAILKGRRGGGSELNPGYFMDQVHYLRAAEREFSMPSLFDTLAEEAA